MVLPCLPKQTHAVSTFHSRAVFGWGVGSRSGASSPSILVVNNLDIRNFALGKDHHDGRNEPVSPVEQREFQRRRRGRQLAGRSQLSQNIQCFPLGRHQASRSVELEGSPQDSSGYEPGYATLRIYQTPRDEDKHLKPIGWTPRPSRSPQPALAKRAQGPLAQGPRNSSSTGWKVYRRRRANHSDP